MSRMRFGTMSSRRLLLCISFIQALLCFVGSCAAARQQSGNDNRFQIRVKLKYSRDRFYEHRATIERSEYRRLEAATNPRTLQRHIKAARQGLLKKKRAYGSNHHMLDGWEMSVYATVERIQLKDRRRNMTTTLFNK